MLLIYVGKGLIDSIDSDIGLAPNRRQAIITMKFGLVYRLIYASLGPNESIKEAHET